MHKCECNEIAGMKNFGIFKDAVVENAGLDKAQIQSDQFPRNFSVAYIKRS